MLAMLKNKHRAAAIMGNEIMYFTNKAKGNNKPLWKPYLPFCYSANPQEAALVWLEHNVVMVGVR